MDLLLFHLFDLKYNHPSYTPGDPARMVPTKLRTDIFLSNIFFWFGGFFFVVGLSGFVVCFSETDLSSFRFGDDVSRVSARLVSVVDANYAENDRHYYEYTYEYKAKDKTYTGSSFGEKKELPKDSMVAIQYQNQSPSTSRIIGMRMARGHFFTLLFVFIFPAIGAMIMLAMLYGGMQSIMTLRHGILTEALITQKIFIRSNDDSPDTDDVYIEFRTRENKLIRTKVNIATGRKARPGKNAPILYLPWDPYSVWFVATVDALGKQVLRDG